MVKLERRQIAVLKGLIWPIVGYSSWVLIIALLSIIADLQCSQRSLNVYLNKTVVQNTESNTPSTATFPNPKVKKYNPWSLLNICLLASLTVAVCSLGVPGILESEKDHRDSVVLVDDFKFPKNIIETLAGKHSIFKNSYRNWLVLQALFVSNSVILLLATGTIFFMILCNGFLATQFNISSLLHKADLKLLQSLPLAIVSLWYLTYRQLHSDHMKKWLFCANVYNKSIEEKGTISEITTLRVALALEVLTLDLWAKRTFAWEFNFVLKSCIGNDVEKLKQGKMTESDAHEILEKYMNGLRTPPSANSPLSKAS